MAVNPFDMLRQFQNLQSRMGEMQQKMRALHVVGSSGGGLVTVEMNGQLDVEKVTIQPQAVDPQDMRMTEDLVLAAMTDCLNRLKERLKEEMSGFAGLNLPPGILGV